MSESPHAAAVFDMLGKLRDEIDREGIGIGRGQSMLLAYSAPSADPRAREAIYAARLEQLIEVYGALLHIDSGNAGRAAGGG